METVTGREKLLKRFLLVYGYLSLVLFGTLSVGLFFHMPAFDKGGVLNWTVWDDMSDHAPLMITVIYFVWSIFLIRSSRNPRAYASFLDFTMWANLAHGLIMIPQGIGHENVSLQVHDGHSVGAHPRWSHRLSADLAWNLR